jgi:hypothetical protein
LLDNNKAYACHLLAVVWLSSCSEKEREQEAITNKWLPETEITLQMASWLNENATL